MINTHTIGCKTFFRDILLLSLVFFSFIHIAHAGTGSLFQIDESGAPGEISLTLCLQAHGTHPLSCQNYTLQISNVSISPTILNHLYPYAGIRVNTPGFTLANLGLDCASTENGYALFPVSNLSPKITLTTNQLYFLSVSDTNPVIAISIDPTNMLYPDLPPITTPAAIPVATLEAIYDQLFCQLNSQHGVTLDSPGCQQLIDYIQEQPGTGHFDLNDQPILNNGLFIEDIAFQKIQYQTTVTLPGGNQTFNVSGGLIMPNDLGYTQVKGVIVYFQGTQFDKSGVGSNINYPGTQVIAALFASQGYVVVIPDYVGMGDDWANVHPYVIYPKISVQTAIDMLTTVKNTIQTKYNFPGGQTLKLFSIGYSEGGAYSLWFNTYLTANPDLLDPFYVLTHSVGMEGAYSISRVTYDYLFGDVVLNDANLFNIQSQSLTNLSKPLLTADALLSYATYSEEGDYLAVFNEEFYNMECTSPVAQSNCDFSGQQLNLLQAFNQAATSPATQALNSALGKVTGIYAAPKSLALLAVDLHNSAISFTSTVLFHLQPALLLTLLEADVNLSGVANDAVSVITLSHDSIVSPNNYNELVQNYAPKIKNAIQLDENNFQVVSPFSYQRIECQLNPHCAPVYTAVDHPQAQFYEYLYALNIFNGF